MFLNIGKSCITLFNQLCKNALTLDDTGTPFVSISKISP